nr:YbdK family carboxylate-amine ligase [Streptomyces silvensis]
MTPRAEAARAGPRQADRSEGRLSHGVHQRYGDDARGGGGVLPRRPGQRCRRRGRSPRPAAGPRGAGRSGVGGVHRLPGGGQDTAAEIEGQLLRIRAGLALAAREEGLRIAASGTPVIDPGGPLPVRADPRHRAGTRTYRAMVDDFALSALHVHVHLPDREHAVLVGNHLRPWLPLLVALAASSPFWRHRDTGYASWRSIVAAQWPQAGPPPYLAGADAYDALAAALHETGATVDEGTLFWDVRPSAHLPTIEIRVMDATTEPRAAAALAALVRAMVHTAHARVRRGDPGAPLCDSLLRAAYWRAARDGFSGHLPHPDTGHLVPAAGLARELAHRLRPALEGYGEWATVVAALDRMTAHGGGAERQRAAYSRRHSLHDVVDHLCRLTVPARTSTGRTALWRPTAHGYTPGQVRARSQPAGRCRAGGHVTASPCAHGPGVAALSPFRDPAARTPASGLSPGA